MEKRFVSIWFRHLVTDWFSICQPGLLNKAFVAKAPSHGRLVVTAANALAKQQGAIAGMALADVKAIIPDVEVVDDIPDLLNRLLQRIAAWCIRFTPVVSVDLPDGLIIDATGCSHLWGSDENYITEIGRRLKERGYHVRVGMADTIGAAWATARFGKSSPIIKTGFITDVLPELPAAALRLEAGTIERLNKLGLRQIKQFISMPRAVLRRRFGSDFILKLDQALGLEEEIIQPILPLQPYQERLPCLEPIVTATGIEIALRKLLDFVCQRLRQEQKGLRMSVFTYYCTDGRTGKIEIGTSRASNNVNHLFKLFEIKLGTVEPGMGIELFVLEAQKVQDHFPLQEKMWDSACGIGHPKLSELLDRISNKFGEGHIIRYLPAEHYWPDRSIRSALSLDEQPSINWQTNRPRPIQLLTVPEQIEVIALIPDYPPAVFRYKGKQHKITHADGPERIEQEWWIQQGRHRDYYYVEDEDGHRYWIFRSGHYTAEKSTQWFLHGFFT